MQVLLIKPVRFDRADVGVGRDVVPGKVVVDDMSESRVDHALFVERHNIKISRKPNLPKGYRATWAERAKLGVAKLYGRIDSATTPDKYSRILLRAGAASESDDFIEVHIFGPMTVLTMEQVIVIAPQAKRATITRAIKSKLAKHNVQVN